MDVGGCLDAGDFTKGTDSVSGVQDLCKRERERAVLLCFRRLQREDEKKKQWCNFNESKNWFTFTCFFSFLPSSVHVLRSLAFGSFMPESHSHSHQISFTSSLRVCSQFCKKFFRSQTIFSHPF